LIVGTIMHDTQSSPGLYLWRNDYGYLHFQSNMFETINATLQNLNLQALPYANFIDIDDDGDLDLAVSCQKLLLFENTGTATTPVWTYRAAFFDSVNQHLTSNANFERVAFCDFDKDGDDDFIVSINRRYTVFGETYFRSEVVYFAQQGSVTEPEWILDSSYLRRAFNGYNDPVILGSIYEDLYTLVLRNETGYMEGFHSSALLPPNVPVIAHDSFIVATYPRTIWVEIDRRDPEIFYGYDGYASWDTAPELEDWTMAVKIGDVDSDGVNEIVVGSFDQNVYVFENLFNDTYRRAWRSPDLTRWDGTRRLWDDVTALTLGDTDLDGLQEIIVTTGTNHGYIFEDAGRSQFVLVATLSLPGFNHTSFVTTINDLDRDTLPELVFASGSLLFFFEAPTDDTHILTWVTEISPIEEIRSLAMGQLDGDIRKELAVVGVNETNGVVVVFESPTNNTLNQVWTPPFHEYETNLAHTVFVTDLYGSGSAEFLVGHDKGVSIYQWNSSMPDDTYTLLQLVSGSFNYLANHEWIDRKLSSYGYKAIEILQRADGSYIVLYQVNQGVVSQSFRIRTSSDGIHWSVETQVFSTGFDMLEEPSITEVNDRLHLIFRGRRTSDSSEGIWLTNSSDGITWFDALNSCYLIPHSNVLSPKITPSPNSNERFILTYIDPLLGINFTRNYWSGGKWVWSQPTIIPLPIEVSISATQGITAISHDIETAFDSEALTYRWVLTLEGVNNTKSTTDTDIWACYSTAQPQIWSPGNWTTPALVTHSNINETAPTLLGLDENYMMVLYHSHDEMKGQVWFFEDKIWSAPTLLQLPSPFTALPMASLTKLQTGGIASSYIATAHDGFDYLFVAHHSTMGWWSTALQEARRVAVVDTNNDGHREMIVNTRHQVFVFTHNLTTQAFSQIWASQIFTQEITDLAVGDTNGNYLVEIIITTKGGNAYAFEWTDTEPPSIAFASSLRDSYTLPATISVEVLAEDAGRIVRVELCVNDEGWIQAQPILGTDIYHATFDLAKVGRVIIRARALDHQGNWSPELYAEVLITTNDPNQPENIWVFNLIHFVVLAFTIVGLLVIVVVARRYKSSNRLQK
ncbi:MAG: VCBS repeat-containing protein, partial [Candidatus Hermodarchaeota archaeon]|nr:VCBS repeat-containing protein [Candidatus Hermodarchaeota archaeon]